MTPDCAHTIQACNDGQVQNDAFNIYGSIVWFSTCLFWIGTMPLRYSVT